MTLTIPSAALVVLIGVAGSGKSTFARTRFRPTEILSSDFFRGMVSDDEGDQEATADAFALLHLALEKRLRRGKLSVIDATNIQQKYRARLIECAQLYQRPAIAIVFETPENLCVERAEKRPNRVVRAAVIRQQATDLAPQLENLAGEGFAEVFRINPSDEVEVLLTSASSFAKSSSWR
jgi:predicted kinase